MTALAALKVAIDLRHVPSRVPIVRSAPLPDGVELLLRIAAGEREYEAQAAIAADRPETEIREAASFFIEQVLLAPDSDSYRVLGAHSAASKTELRRNMALLLRWLHPDLDREGTRSLFARHVIRAWHDVSTPERRAQYDRRRTASDGKPAGNQRSGIERVRSRPAKSPKMQGGSAWSAPPVGARNLVSLSEPTLHMREQEGLFLRAMRILLDRLRQ